MTEIILVRHGQTEWNRNETGLAQAEATGRRIANTWKPTAIYSSPLSRAVETAKAIAKHFGLTVQPHAGLADIDYGAWQGLSPQEAQQQWPEIVDAWYNRPHLAHIPNGETLEALRQRAMAAVKDLAARHPKETIVLVGHTVINRIILLGILGLGNERFWRIKQDTCAINVFEVEEEDFTLVSLNDTCHLLSVPAR
jgi:broad specificity phosphatase PhoE